MLNQIQRGLSSLFFPWECALCEVVLALDNTGGVCQKCQAQIKRMYPPYCPSCGRTTISEGAPCPDCWGERFYFDRAFACSLYEGRMKELLHLYKFGRRKSLKHFFISLALGFVRENLKSESFDAVAAVPVSPNKKAERGFNQSQLISKEVAKDLKLSDASGALLRPRASLPQSSLTRTDRQRNVQGSFFVKDKASFIKRHVLLVDDILTTGYTASECARVVKEAGAASVSVLALARGL